MGAFSWLRPGNDRELAADLSTQRRKNHRRGIPKAAREGQAWEDADRDRETGRRGRRGR